MDKLIALADLNYFDIFLGIIVVVIAYKFLSELWDWFLEKTGIEFRHVRKQNEDHQLLVTTAENLAALQEKHEKDESDIKACLASFISETKKENDSLRAEMKRFAENRISDRQISIEREGRLNCRIDTIAESDRCRDEHIDNINESINKLTLMLVEKEIQDMRWTILDFTSSLSNGREYNAEAFNHIFYTYDRYERILEEHDMENGLIEESMKYIREKYNEKLKGEL